LIWLEPHVLHKLRLMRGPSESHSDVILRLAGESARPKRGYAMPRVLNYKRNGLPPGAVYIGRAMPSYGAHRLRRCRVISDPVKSRRFARTSWWS